MAAILRLRPDVEAFAQMMEFNLMCHDEDRGKRGWIGCDPLWLLERLKEEMLELEMAVLTGRDPLHPGRPKSPGSVRKEAADVGNYAMMIAVVAGLLDGTTPAESA